MGVPMIVSQATERRRHSLTVHVLKHEALVRTSEATFDRAEALWREVLAHEPEAAAHHTALGAVLVIAHRLDAAAAAYEKAASLGGRRDVYRQLAAIYARLGRPADRAAARQKFEQSMTLPTSGRGR